ncbi:hypothetical protein DITRI_Ditri02bG0121800 [Diplodiscus trichospermus]
MSTKKKEKWKNISIFTHIFLLLQLLVCFAIQSVSSQAWDGVIVIAADFQALQVFKQELIDSKGFLKSWNDSGYGACSGGWVGIKCAQGQVIVIQFPWKALGILPDLRGVKLFSNRLSSSIPASLCSCPLLQTLDLSNNSLSGIIPESLSNSTKFYRLNLSFNSFSGSIPG